MNDIWSGCGSPQNGPARPDGAPELQYRLVRESQWCELVGVLKEHEILLAALLRNATGASREPGRDRTVQTVHRNARERQGPRLELPRSENH